MKSMSEDIENASLVFSTEEVYVPTVLALVCALSVPEENLTPRRPNPAASQRHRSYKSS